MIGRRDIADSQTLCPRMLRRRRPYPRLSLSFFAAEHLACPCLVPTLRSRSPADMARRSGREYVTSLSTTSSSQADVWFLTHAAPDVGVEDIHAFEDRTMGGLPVLLERAVIVDRCEPYLDLNKVRADCRVRALCRRRDGAVGQGTSLSDFKVRGWLSWLTTQMNANVPLVEAPLDYWEPIRRNMLRSSGVDHSSKHGTRGLPVVVYIDRQRDSPKLSDASHEALIEALKGLTDVAEVHVTKLGGMTKAQQVDLMGRAEVVLSLHADELRQQLWMKATGRSAVIEVFEEGCFIRQLHSSCLS